MTINLSLKQTRAYIIKNQLLSGKPAYSGEAGTKQVIEQLGYVQIDTISVIARAHHHILYTRIPDYSADFLQAVEKKRQVFEYWAHAASYLPMKDFRFSMVQMEKIKAGSGHWRKRDPKVMKWVYDQVRAEGPKMAKDFEKEKKLSYDHPWGGHPVKQALQQLFMEGDLMITERRGFQKVFDLKERVLPNEVDTQLPTLKEYHKYLIRRDLSANGLMKAREIGHLITIPQKELSTILEELIESEDLVKVSIKGLEPDTYYALKEPLSSFEISRSNKQLKILSPFDNLVIQRKRMQNLFNFNYTLECYVTAAKRKVGYFSLPLLWGITFVGQIDLKVDRKKKVLYIKNLIWESTIKNKSKISSALIKALSKFSTFNDCLEIKGLEKFGIT